LIAVANRPPSSVQVGANIIAMYPSTSVFVAVGQLAIAILVLFSYPLQVHPCRNCLDKVFHFRTLAAGKRQDDGDGDGEDEHGPAGGEMSALRLLALTGAIVAGGFAIAYFVDDLQMVLSFVGSTGSTTISFILPGLFYWQVRSAAGAAPRKRLTGRLARR
jgi:amino acid permease